MIRNSSITVVIRLERTSLRDADIGRLLVGKRGQLDPQLVEVERGDYSPAQFAAIMTLETIAGTEPLPRNPSKSDLERVLRAARGKAHPDRTGGDRARWDQVEQAARKLGL